MPLLVKDTAADRRFENLFRTLHRVYGVPDGNGKRSPRDIAGGFSGETHMERRRFAVHLQYITYRVRGSFNSLLYEKVEQLAEKDSLTGLFVRYRFDERADELFARASVTDTPLSLLIVDLDHFKQVNDQWGHLSGDIVLRQVAETILEKSREIDFCARYGGEEMAVLMPSTSLESAFQFADRVREAVSDLSIGPDKIRVTFSGGVAV